MFSQASVILSIWEVYTPGQTPPLADTPRQIPIPRQTSPSGQTPPLGRHPLGRHPLGRHTSPGKTPPVDIPPMQTQKADPPPLRRALQRTVRMILECILVFIQFLAQIMPINRLTTPSGIGAPCVGNPGSVTDYKSIYVLQEKRKPDTRASCVTRFCT